MAYQEIIYEPGEVDLQTAIVARAGTGFCVRANVYRGSSTAYLHPDGKWKGSVLTKTGPREEEWSGIFPNETTAKTALAAALAERKSDETAA